MTISEADGKKAYSSSQAGTEGKKASQSKRLA